MLDFDADEVILPNSAAPLLHVISEEQAVMNHHCSNDHT